MHRLISAIAVALLIAPIASAAEPTVSDAAVMVRVADADGASSVLSGVVVSSDGQTVVAVSNAHGFREWSGRGVELVWPGRGSAPVELAYRGNPEDKRDDLVILIGQFSQRVPAAQLAPEPARPGETLIAPGFPRARPAVHVYRGPMLRRVANGGLVAGFGTEQGASGSGVFNESGYLVGILWGSDGAEAHAVDVSQLRRAYETSCRGRFGGILQRIRGRFTGRGSPQTYAQPQQFAAAGGSQAYGPQGCPVPQGQPRAYPIQQGGGPQAYGPEGSGPDLPRPDLNAPSSLPATPPQMAPAQSVSVEAIAERLADDERLREHLAADERFRGPPGPVGPPGMPGMKGPPAQVDYERIAEHVRGDATLIGSVAAVAGESIEIPSLEADTEGPGWLESITRTAAALGLDMAIPGGTAGTMALWGLSAYWRHRRQRLEIEGRTQPGPPPPSPHPYTAAAPPRPNQSIEEPPDPFPIDRPE